ncbi:MAG: PAS domain-containing protein [Parvibaculum sp.]|nr:PAS domain-containing protein [Parvibaculum sp.]
MLGEIDILQTDGARQFFSYWDSLPKDGLVPDRSDFSPVGIARLMSAVTILEIISDELILQRLAGTGVCRAIGFDPTGRNTLDLIAAKARPRYLDLIRSQTSHPCGRWNIICTRRDNMVERAEVVALPMRYRRSGHWMIIAYFAPLKPIAYEPGPYEILSYEDIRWIDIGAGVPPDQPGPPARRSNRPDGAARQ